jgi:HlyD family secretion protein
LIQAAWGGAIVAVAVLLTWHLLKISGDNKIIVSGNGRIEAVEIDVAAKSGGVG